MWKEKEKDNKHQRRTQNGKKEKEREREGRGQSLTHVFVGHLFWSLVGWSVGWFADFQSSAKVVQRPFNSLKMHPGSAATRRARMAHALRAQRLGVQWRRLSLLQLLRKHLGPTA